MAGTNSWRPVVTSTDWVQQLEKRLLNEERRPQIAAASDLLGPGAGPYAVQIWDWNSDEGAFNGIFFSDPSDGQINSPDDVKHWLGETFGTDDGNGFQRLTVYRTEPIGGTGDWTVYRRRFYLPPDGEVRVYGPWE